MNTIELTPITDAEIHAIGHDGNSTLAIQFKRHGQPAAIYHYQNFTAERFRELQMAESIYGYFMQHIKANTTTYPYTKAE